MGEGRHSQGARVTEATPQSLLPVWVPHWTPGPSPHTSLVTPSALGPPRGGHSSAPTGTLPAQGPGALSGWLPTAPESGAHALAWWNPSLSVTHTSLLPPWSLIPTVTSGPLPSCWHRDTLLWFLERRRPASPPRAPPPLLWVLLA